MNKSIKIFMGLAMQLESVATQLLLALAERHISKTRKTV